MAQKVQPNVTFVRSELQAILMEYCLIHDCIEGEAAVKGYRYYVNPIFGYGSDPIVTYATNFARFADNALNIVASKAKRYLPQPNPSDSSKENNDRYLSYVTRAVFYNATGRTLDGMAGQVFQVKPVIEIPDLLKALRTDADGTGVNLEQLAMRTLRYVLPYGRAGLFVDYPPVAGATTRKQLLDGDIRPTIAVYAPWDVLNWRTVQRGAKQVLSLVVLREYVNSSDDEFEYQSIPQYRVLRLRGDTYEQQIYQRANAKASEYAQGPITSVVDAAGKPLRDIPFCFVGSENNDASVDKPPMYDVATLNIAHYRNSADFEESSFVTGQPTITLSGLSEEWVKNVLNGVVPLGSRAAIPLPVGGKAEMLQADPNTLPGEAMDKKERQMVALGAKLVQQQQVQRTATEAGMEGSSETSILANVASNVSTAITWALGVAASFVAAASDAIKFELNTEFQLNRMTADEQSKIIAGWMKGAITFGEMRSALRKAGTASLPDDEAMTKIKAEMAVMFPTGLEANPFGTAPPATPPANPDPNVNPAQHGARPATQGR